MDAGIGTLNILRASAALPAAGAWDAAPTVVAAARTSRITLYCSYTRGGAGGACDFQIQVSPYSVTALAPAGGAEWLPIAQYTGGILAAGADVQSRVQREYVTYQATGAGQEAFAFGPIEIEAIERVRVTARESGNVGAPGTLQIQGVLR
jgi:hypothetical protein